MEYLPILAASLLTILTIALTIMRHWLGFLAGALWSLLPIYGSYLPPGTGLVALNLGLLVVGLIAGSRHALGALFNPSLFAALGVALSIYVQQVVRPAESGDSWMQLLGAITAAGLLGWTGTSVSWRQGYAAGLATGGILLGIAELLRVVGGGVIHGQEAAFGINPIVLGQYCGLSVLVILFQVGRSAWSAAALVPGVTALVGLVVTGSRGPLLAVVLASAYSVAMARPSSPWRPSRILRLAGSLLFVITTLAMLSAGGVDLAAWFRLDDTDGNAGSRVIAWRGAVATIMSNPLAGAGPGRYYDGTYGGWGGLPEYPHNIWLEAWSEYGIVSALLLTLTTIAAWLRSSRAGKSFIVFGVIAFCLSGSLDASVVFWVSLMIAASTHSVAPRGEEQSADARALSVVDKARSS